MLKASERKSVVIAKKDWKRLRKYASEKSIFLHEAVSQILDKLEKNGDK